MPKSILVSNSNILGHSSVVVEPYGDPFIGDIIWSWNYFKSLSSNPWILIESSVRKMDNRGEFFDIENRIFFEIFDRSEDRVI